MHPAPCACSPMAAVAEPEAQLLTRNNLRQELEQQEALQKKLQLNMSAQTQAVRTGLLCNACALSQCLLLGLTLAL
eukprot:1161005-Pelagomonas_calceolata.AAC.7